MRFPGLQARYNALASSLIVGLIWGLWHIPLFFIKGTTQYEWYLSVGLLVPILAYTAFTIAWSVQFTWVFNHAKGSVLLAAVQHGATNAWNGYIDVYRDNFGGILVYMAVSLVLSLVIVLMAGRTNLSRTHARNVVGPGEMEPRAGRQAPAA